MTAIYLAAFDFTGATEYADFQRAFNNWLPLILLVLALFCAFELKKGKIHLVVKTIIGAILIGLLADWTVIQEFIAGAKSALRL